jgi:hypothetical protein
MLKRQETNMAQFFTPQTFHSISEFATERDFYQNMLDEINTGTCHEEFIYTEAPPDWATSVLDKVDSATECRSVRYELLI